MEWKQKQKTCKWRMTNEDDAENEDGATVVGKGEEEWWDGEGKNEDNYSDCVSEEQHDEQEDDDSRIQSDEAAEDQQ